MKIRVILALFLVLGVVSLFGQKKSKIPDWASKKPTSPTKEYFVGMSEYKFGKSAEGLESAKKNCMGEVAAYVSSEISSVMKDNIVSMEKDGEEKTYNYIQKELTVVSNAEVAGVVFEQLHEDKSGRKWYVLASIEKSKAEELIANSLDPVGYQIRKALDKLHKTSPDVNSVVISNFNYKGKHYSGEVSSYIKAKISSAFVKIGYFSEYNDPEFNKYLDQTGLTTRGVAIDRNEQVDDLYSKVQGFISGSYWDNQDKLEFQIKFYDMREKKYTFDEMFAVKKDQFSKIKLHPDNLDDFSKKYEDLSKMFESQSFNIKVWPDKGDYSTYKEGEYLIPHFLSNKDCYLRIYLVCADGNALMLFPNFYDKNNFVKKNQVYKIGDPAFSPFKLRLAPPFGTEMLIAVASSTDFKDDTNYENDIPVFEGEKLRGVIIENAGKQSKDQIAQATAVYTIIPKD